MLNSLLIDKIPVGLVIFDESIQIISTNIASEATIKKTGNYIVDVIKRLVLKTLDNNCPIEKIIKYISMNGFNVWKVRTELIDYSPIKVLVIIEEITLFHRLQATVLKAEKLAVIGHKALGSLTEIRNPLTSSIGFCRFIEHNSEFNMEYIKIISDELEEIQKIIENCNSVPKKTQLVNFEMLYGKICTSLGQLGSIKLIAITDELEDIPIFLTEKNANTIITELIKALDIFAGEDILIIINVESHTTERFVLNIQLGFLDGYKGEMIKDLEDKTKQIELRLVNDHALALSFLQPIVIPS